MKRYQEPERIEKSTWISKDVPSSLFIITDGVQYIRFHIKISQTVFIYERSQFPFVFSVSYKLKGRIIPRDLSQSRKTMTRTFYWLCSHFAVVWLWPYGGEVASAAKGGGKGRARRGTMGESGGCEPVGCQFEENIEWRRMCSGWVRFFLYPYTYTYTYTVHSTSLSGFLEYITMDQVFTTGTGHKHFDFCWFWIWWQSAGY
jgi:hypothetical protein